MKKIYFCLPAILTGVLQLSAQDIITKCNGEEIAAKVAEIGDTQIKYRKYENAQGPTLSRHQKFSLSDSKTEPARS